MAAALRVASWNIRAAIGPGPFPDRWWSRIDADRLRAIGDAIRALDADVVGLQEVALLSRNGDLVDNAGDLARQLGMALRYAAVRSFEVVEDGRLLGVGCFGNALLTKEPPVAAHAVALPQAAPDAYIEPPGSGGPAAGVRYREAPPTIREPRSLLVADLGDALRVGVTHLSHVGSGERLLQAAAVVEALAPGPAVLLGDLNAAVDAPELAPLAPWADAFAEPPGDPGRHSTDDGHPIDHVLGLGLTVGAARVVRDADGLSDHAPVVADVTLDGSAAPTSFVASSLPHPSR